MHTLSDYGLQTYEGSDVTAYGVGKAAQFGLMNMLAGEGVAHGIFVNAICPVAATRIFRRKVAPGELLPKAIAPGVLFLASMNVSAHGEGTPRSGWKVCTGTISGFDRRGFGCRFDPRGC